MNKSAIKIAAISCCAALAIGGAGAAYIVSADQETAQETESTQSVETAENTESTADAKSEAKADDSSEETADVAKDETVYILAGADGSVQKLIVSDWLKNTTQASQIFDVTELTDIENVKGDETYTAGSGNSAVWDAQGSDIYYQGNTDKTLPVTLKVSYKLDGNDISAEELVGKSGKVTIRYDYENNQYEMVTIDGKEEKIYVPYAMITAMMLDNDVFSNVEVTNGSITNDGDRMVIVGTAFPGLQENLALDKEEYDIPDYVEITADVTDFSMSMSVTIATNEVFSNLDTSKLDSADDLIDSMDDLSDGMGQLLDGSSELYDGLATLLEKSGDLVTGVGQLSDGAKELKDGAATLSDGATQVETGLDSLSSGLSELSGNNQTLTDGAKTVFQSLLATANSELEEAGLTVKKLTIKNYATVLDDLIESLDDTNVYNQALTQVTAEVEKNRSLIEQKVTEAVQEQVEAKVTEAVQAQVESKVTETVKVQVSAQVISAATGMTSEAYAAAVSAGLVGADTQAAVDAAVEAQMETDTVKATIAANTAAQMETADVQALIATNTEAQMKTDEVAETISENVETQVQQAITENMASDTVQAQLEAASEGAKAVIDLKASLDSYNTFYVGLKTYTKGVASAASGAAELYTGASALADGAGELKDGASDLYDGVGELKDGVSALVDGVKQLKDGSKELYDGMVTFDEEGIQKLVDAADGDLGGLIDRIRATVAVSGNYRNFSGISDDMDGKVTFIYRVDEIKEAEEAAE